MEYQSFKRVDTATASGCFPVCSPYQQWTAQEVMNLNCNEVKFRLDLGKIQLRNKDTEVLKEIEKVFESFSF